MKEKLQRFGKFLSSMIMPNIGAFIAWGLITALFIPDGWIPNESMASIQPYMLTYLIPILIAGTGGKIVAGERGMIMGAIAIVGCIAGVGGTEGQPMLLAAMLIGPLAGVVIKYYDKLTASHIKPGFEMLNNNFSIGILGMGLAIFGYFVIGPVMLILLEILSAGVAIIIEYSLLPLLGIFIEPAKVLFLNNAINHGIFTPIGIQQVTEMGKSIMYLLETNPGPGLGVLLAYCFFSKEKTARQSAPGAVVIHFFGGIHEIYFPYILMRPQVIIAPIVGNVAAITFFMLTDTGLKAPASPGSIVALLSMSPKEDIVFVLIGVVIAAALSFLIASPIVRKAPAREDIDQAKERKDAMKAKASGRIEQSGPNHAAFGEIKMITFACDAGMGSSAMGATKFRKRLSEDRPEIIVNNSSVDDIPAEANIVVVQNNLFERARKSAPNAVVVSIGNLLADPGLDDLFEKLVSGEFKQNVADENENKPSQEASSNDNIMNEDSILLNQEPTSQEEAIKAAGELLVKQGCVDSSYIDAMLEREKISSTYMGMGLAIPHGTKDAKNSVKKTGIVFVQCPNGVDFGQEKAYLIVGIAGVGDEHLGLLSRISEALDDDQVLEKMKTTKDVSWILETLSK